MADECGNCRFFREEQAAGIGLCRVADPLVTTSAGAYARQYALTGYWPSVRTTDWCGRWQAADPGGTPVGGTLRLRAGARINAAGTVIDEQGGVTCIKGGPGVYDVSFLPMGSPPILPTAVVIGAEMAVSGQHAYMNLSESGVRVTMYNTTGNASDRAFSIMIL